MGISIAVMTIAQHLQASSKVCKLKGELKKVEISLDSALNANITLARENLNLKECISTLEKELKGLETHAIIAEASTK